MDNTTIYEFLQEKSVIPTGPGSYSDSTEMSNALKVFKKNNSSKIKGKKDVNFYDYDGSLVDSYSTEDFLQLSAMPANPSHEGLTSQGWNYTLSDAKEYVSDYGKLDIGQMYITDDGKTRIHIKLEEGRLKPRLGLGVNGSVVVDWGDDSATDTMTGTSLSTAVYQEHEYSVAGEYTISIAVTGEIAFMGDSSNRSLILTKAEGNSNTNRTYQNCIQSICLGSGIISIDNYALNNCYSLSSITIPSGITSIGNNVFNNCCSLTNITIPSGITGIGNNVFNSCCSLTNITIPNTVTSIDSSAFSYCYSLTNITIPSTVTSIGGSVFNNCYSLTNITIPNTVTSIDSSVFNSCYSLTNITIPSTVTSIDSSVFNSCYSLTNITIPSTVTSIGSSAFNNCCSLTNITIPSTVTSIGSNAFNYCYGLGFIKFESSTPPTVSSTSAWANIPSDCIIYVPTGSLSTYTSNNKYPSSSTYTYVEY